MKKYKVIHASNFSIGDQEFYLVAGEVAELPDHELIEAMLVRGYLEPVKAESKKTVNDKK
jgi:hypothetical protein